MLRNRTTWRNRMDGILKQKNISTESILRINESLYDDEIKGMIDWLLDDTNLKVSEEDIFKHIG